MIIRYNRESNTLDIWFGNPIDKFICGEIGDGIILKKDKDGNVIGIEKLYISKRVGISSSPLEVMIDKTLDTQYISSIPPPGGLYIFSILRDTNKKLDFLTFNFKI
ncbi:MAG TPA: DUF2283 domain-containing protein [bacterium]|nr:DUF2283 domain-containing protein [bacterium]HOM26396.1 DUF2283 domain-containing protein [bacterium]